MPAQEITFVVPGQALPADKPAAGGIGTVRAAARVSARRAGGETVRLTAQPGEDIVLLHVANGPTLYLHPEDARELLRAQAGAVPQTGRSAGTLPPPNGDVVVPAQLGWRGLDSAAPTRGKFMDWIGDVALDGIEVVTGLFKGKAGEFAAKALAQKLDGQVDAGVYRLSPKSLGKLKGNGDKVAQVPPPPDGAPMLVLVHGTFVETASTFGKLWAQHLPRVEALFKHYGDRVYALDHPTVAVNPFANALTLVRTLPPGARLHLVTHSRGGIVAEALARICGGQGVSKADLALFDGEGYAQQRADLSALAKEIKAREIKVDRLVRIACPARGTLLASRRLDAYLSVLKWGLELTGVVIAAELVDFLAAVARERTDPTKLMGLEAMMPSRPMADWLNAPAEPVPGDLRVVAGDIEGDSLMSWLKTLLSDAFYWTDNDLVVQTRSMYGGTPRTAGAATFVLDRGGKVTHFNYFANERTADVITRALTQAQPADFHPIGPLSWAGEDASGTRAARAVARSRTGDPAERPAVFVLPGILGSHLKVDDKRVWLSLRFFNNLDRLKWDPNTAARVKPDGPVGISYDDLIEHLAQTHEVIDFSFDWRRPIEEEARRLADAVDAALAVRDATQKPVRIVAHSMGGIVARTMQLERPETWKRLMSRAGARFLMLGTPNGGSYAPMQVMSGDDTFGNLLAMFGSLFDDHGARQFIAGMPGLLQLQAGLVNGTHGLDRAENWQKLEDADLDIIRARVNEQAFWHRDELQIQAYKWGLPSQAVLDQAVALRKRLDKQREELGADAAKVLLVVGKARFTPADLKITPTGVVYLDAPEDGDGRVTFDSACLPGVKTWQVDAAHGDLADVKEAFPAYVELLVSGDTNRLPVAAPTGATRGAAAEPRAVALVPSRPARAMRSAEPPALFKDVFALAAGRVPQAAAAGAPLRITVVNGNLKFVREPLMLGHYRSLKLTGTEWVIDRLLGGTMGAALQAGSYPAAIGSAQVFVNNRRNPDDPFVLPRPAAAIVVGLGEEGSLRMTDLADTVRQGVLAYAQRAIEEAGGGPTNFELATVLLGSGGSNISAGTSAQAIAIGVRQANQRLAQVGWPLVSHVKLIELYLDRATEALQAFDALSDMQAQNIVLEPRIKPELGGLPRPPDAGYRGAEYDFISIQQREVAEGAGLEFTLATRRARDEVRGVMPQSKLVNELVCAGASDANDDPQIGRTLFKLLVPLEIEPFLSGSASVVIQLDEKTAALPWELLDTQGNEFEKRDDVRPWAVRTRLLRKLRTENFREQPHDVSREASVLVIGEPLCDTEKYPPLPGAAAEARAVAEVLGVKPVLNERALTIVNSVLDRSYRILHVAGHGDVIGGIGGVVLSNGTMFGPREVKAMRRVPELAFINCCHLGRFDTRPLEKINRLNNLPGALPGFAANVAEQLISIGVRCVVAAGWAVDDAPAELFARRFYAALMNGRPFIEAVCKAREAIWREYPHSNTWAAYQCYGDPYWTYVGAADGADTSRPLPEIAAAESLVLHLDGARVAHSYGDRETERVRADVAQLEAGYAAVWGTRGTVAAAFGAAYAEIGDFARAIDWYSRAIAAEDSSVPLRAMEQLGNVRARYGAKLADRAQGRKEVNAAIELLERLAAVAPTVERESLLGSAFNRLANIEAAAGAKRAALAQALEHYGKAENIARESGAPNLFYPAMQRMSIALVLSVDSAGSKTIDPADIDAARESLLKQNAESADFWSVVGLTELRIYEALAARRLAPALDSIAGDIKDLMGRASSRRMWDSVAHQASLTLTPYIKSKHVSAAEREAAQQLLMLLGAETGSDADTGANAEANASGPDGPENEKRDEPARARTKKTAAAKRRKRKS